MPHNPQEWYKGCQQGIKELKVSVDCLEVPDEFTKWTLESIFFEGNSNNKVNTTHHRSKRFLGGLIRGIRTIFKVGNIFGKIVSGIKKVGGFIFKGIKGLFHRHKNTALLQAVKTFTSSLRKFLV